MKTHKSFSFNTEEKDFFFFFQFEVINFNVTLAYLFIWDLDFRLLLPRPWSHEKGGGWYFFSLLHQLDGKVKESTFVCEVLENSKEQKDEEEEECEQRGLCSLNFIFFMAEWFMIYYFASTIKMLYECDKNVL